MISSASAARLFFLLLCTTALGGCAGYRVGDISGRDLQGVHSVYVPVARNDSVEPDIQVVVTNDVIRRFENDGTLSVNQNADSDSEFDITIDIGLPLAPAQQLQRSPDHGRVFADHPCHGHLCEPQAGQEDFRERHGQRHHHVLHPGPTLTKASARRCPSPRPISRSTR